MTKTIQKYYNTKTKNPHNVVTMKVVNNTATMFYYEYTIVQPCKKPDGFYKNIDFNILDENPAGFVEKSFNAAVTTRVTLKDLTWVAQAMSEEETRYFLCGVYFNNCDMVATDGHRLHKVDTYAFPIEKGFIVPSATVKIALDLCKEYKLSEEALIDISHDGGDNVRILVAKNSYVDSKKVDGVFPIYERVFPKAWQEFTQVKWDGFCKEQVATVNAAKKAYKIKLPIITFEPDGYAVLNEAKIVLLNSPFNTRVSFNFNLLKEIGAGTWYENPDFSAPHVIKDGNRLSIIMPMRV